MAGADEYDPFREGAGGIRAPARIYFTGIYFAGIYFTSIIFIVCTAQPVSIR